MEVNQAEEERICSRNDHKAEGAEGALTVERKVQLPFDFLDHPAQAGSLECERTDFTRCRSRFVLVGEPPAIQVKPGETARFQRSVDARAQASQIEGHA